MTRETGKWYTHTANAAIEYKTTEPMTSVKEMWNGYGGAVFRLLRTICDRFQWTSGTSNTECLLDATQDLEYGIEEMPLTDKSRRLLHATVPLSVIGGSRG